MFVINSLSIGSGQYLSGKAAVENNPSVDERETGVLIARRMTFPTSGLNDISEMARTTAHEIGHLLFNSIFDDHDNRSWNLIRSGELGSTNGADLETISKHHKQPIAIQGTQTGAMDGKTQKELRTTANDLAGQ